MEEVLKRFKFICRKCGSDNTVFDYTGGSYGSEETGYMPGDLVVGCNDCKDNDYITSF